MIFSSESENETFLFACELAKKAEAGNVICLDGDLGAGKTVFASGFAAGLGIKEPVCSPTFTILQVYEEGRLPLYHFDVYRIEDPDEMYEIGFDDYIFGNGVCLIEWGCLIREILPENTLYITLNRDPDKGFDHRDIIVEPDPAEGFSFEALPKAKAGERTFAAEGTGYTGTDDNNVFYGKSRREDHI